MNRMQKYQPSKIERKWQKVWKDNKIYQVDLGTDKKKFYLLVEFPYSSGDLHIGHWFAFAVTDIFGRMKRMQGYNVFFPVGFDSFGLPAENAAIKRKLHPYNWTLKNIEAMTKQFHLMGAIHDWDHVVVTCLPEYYKWNQWIFLKMLERGVAYRGRALSNWCPQDSTVLADEQVVSGKCDRCGSDVQLKEVPQWFLKITAYADRLLWPSDAPSTSFGRTPFDKAQGRQDKSLRALEGKKGKELDWPKSVREGQNNWIGKSEGTMIDFSVKGKDCRIKVFTTRADTLFGATFLVLAPEHPLVSEISAKSRFKVVREYQKTSAGKSQVERKEMKEKTGVLTGAYAINPINGEEIPIWIADYVLSGYGTGALFGDAHDERDVEFAKKYQIALKPTLKTGNKQQDERIKSLKEVFVGDGILFDSGKFSGLTSALAREKITEQLEKQRDGYRHVNYHLHDWSISRQRYWGTPIPIINCPKCGAVPVPYEDLPVELPYDVDFTPSGKPPLASAEEWMRVKCPKCAGEAQREPETMDGFFDNSWYFFRYLSPKDEEQIFDQSIAKIWMPVDVYFGGAEHTLGHTMYSRFFTKFFKDIGLVDFEEYATRRVNHGVILGSDARRMSKSRGNVVNPDEEVKSYGADAIRTYLAFVGPYDLVAPWNPGGIRGVYNFLQRVWRLADAMNFGAGPVSSFPPASARSEYKLGRKQQDQAELRAVGSPSRTATRYKAPTTLSGYDIQLMHKTIKKVTEDIENIKFNTAVAALMEWLNALEKRVVGSSESVVNSQKRKDLLRTINSELVTREEMQTFLLLLAPFAPHLTEELWQQVHSFGIIDHSEGSMNYELKAKRTQDWSIHQQPWPTYDPKLVQSKMITLVVQVNGKVRDKLPVEAGISQTEAEKLAISSQKIQKFLGSKSPKKIIFIPDRLINLVT